VTRQRTPKSLLLHCAGTAAAVSVLALTTAAAVFATGRSEDARSLLGLDFGGVNRSLGDAITIAAHNTALAGGVLACATALPRLSRRLVVDVLLATILTLNAAAIGLAIGAYGARAITALAPHAPFELAAFSLAGGAYMQARKQAITARLLTLIATTCAVLLAAAGFLETYVRLGESR
jgi:hypothetical protein